MPSTKLQIVITAVDKASKDFKKASNSMKEFGKTAAKASAIVGGLAFAIGTKAVMAAAEFEEGMSNISTLVDTATESMEDMKKEVIAMSKKMPVALKDLTSALYQVRSAGIDASGAMDVLEASVKLATAGLGTTEEATDLLTSAINAFGLDSSEAERHANTFFLAVKAGKTTVAELARGFGQLAPLANEVGIQFEEIAAVTSAMTTSGLKASIAYAQVRAMISNLLKPTREMQVIFEKLNITNIKTTLTEKGLTETIRILTGAMDGNQEMMAKAFGSIEGLNAVMMLMNETGIKADEILKTMTEDQLAMNEAYEKQLATFKSQWQILQNQLNPIMIELGNKIIPKLIEGIKILPFYLEVMHDWWKKSVDVISNFIVKIDQAYIAAQKVRNIAKSIYTLGLANVLGQIKEPKSLLVPATANGGIVMSPQIRMVGEAGPEAIIPLNRGGFGNTYIVKVEGGNYLSEDAAEMFGNIIISKLKENVRI